MPPYQVVASKFIDSVGSLYRLELVNADYYGAHPINRLYLPNKFHDYLAVFKKYYQAALCVEAFPGKSIKNAMKVSLLEDSMQSLVAMEKVLRRLPRNPTAKEG